MNGGGLSGFLCKCCRAKGAHCRTEYRTVQGKPQCGTGVFRFYRNPRAPPARTFQLAYSTPVSNRPLPDQPAAAKAARTAEIRHGPGKLCHREARITPIRKSLFLTAPILYLTRYPCGCSICKKAWAYTKNRKFLLCLLLCINQEYPGLLLQDFYRNIY